MAENVTVLSFHKSQCDLQRKTFVDAKAKYFTIHMSNSVSIIMGFTLNASVDSQSHSIVEFTQLTRQSCFVGGNSDSRLPMFSSRFGDRSDKKKHELEYAINRQLNGSV